MKIADIKLLKGKIKSSIEWFENKETRKLSSFYHFNGIPMSIREAKLRGCLLLYVKMILKR